RRQRARVLDVGDEHFAAHAGGGGDLLLRVARALVVAMDVERHGRAFLGQPQRDAEADALRRAGDQGHAPGQPAGAMRRRRWAGHVALPGVMFVAPILYSGSAPPLGAAMAQPVLRSPAAMPLMA